MKTVTPQTQSKLDKLVTTTLLAKGLTEAVGKARQVGSVKGTITVHDENEETIGFSLPVFILASGRLETAMSLAGRDVVNLLLKDASVRSSIDLPARQHSLLERVNDILPEQGSGVNFSMIMPLLFSLKADVSVGYTVEFADALPDEGFSMDVTDAKLCTPTARGSINVIDQSILAHKDAQPLIVKATAALERAFSAKGSSKVGQDADRDEISGRYFI